MEINFIEANIGAGKSTLLRNLESIPGIICVQEPVNEWIKEYGLTQTDSTTGEKTNVNILQLFYQNPSRNAFLFQMMVLMNRYRHIKSTVDYIISTKRFNEPVQIFIERSIDTDINCFAMNAKENGFLNEIEWKVYCDWMNWFKKEVEVMFLNAFIHKIRYIFIDVSSEICYQRMAKRNRTEEATVGIEYLKQIEEKHLEWKKRLTEYPFPVCKVSYHSIDGSKTEMELKEDILKFIQ